METILSKNGIRFVPMAEIITLRCENRLRLNAIPFTFFEKLKILGKYSNYVVVSCSQFNEHEFDTRTWSLKKKT